MANASIHPSLLVFADDWGRDPSSCQHLIQQLLPSYHAAWVNTIGMRRPSLDYETLMRVAGKVRSYLQRGRREQPLPANLTVLSPWMWPWFSTARDRGLNRRLLGCQLGRWVRRQRGPVVGITTLPIVADIMDDLPVSRWVYYCVDDFGKWPGLDQCAMDSMERRVIERADVLIAVSDTLKDKLSECRRNVSLLKHGVDLEHWQTSTQPSKFAYLQELPRPLVVFWGLIDDRMDVRFLERLADVLHDGTILLVGRLQCPDQALLRLERVQHAGVVAYSHLPSFGQAADVLVMPYVDAPVTRAMQPLKLLEYLATGKPVVVRALPSTRPWAKCLDLATTPEEFSTLVCERAHSGLPHEQKAARARLSDEGWIAKAQQFERLALR